MFGVFGSTEAANLTYLGLHALQHRGQESAGIAVADSGRLSMHKELGLVRDVFHRADLTQAYRRPRDRPCPLLDGRRLGAQERPADRGRLRARLARGRPQRKPHQLRGAACPTRIGWLDLPVHERQRSPGPSDRALQTAQPRRSRRRRAAPGTRCVLALVPDRRAVDRGARSVRLPPALAGAHQGRWLGLRVRAAGVRADRRPTTCATSSRARWWSSATRASRATTRSARASGACASSSTCTSRGPTLRSAASASTTRASAWAARWRARTRSKPTSSYRCPIAASLRRSATRTNPRSRSNSD